MWICVRCETYNQDDQTLCRICGANKPISNIDVEDSLSGTQIIYDQPSQVMSDSSPTPKPMPKPSAEIRPSAPMEPVKSKPKSGISTSEKIIKEIELEEKQKEIARKRRVRRIALAIVNGTLLIANIITVIWIVR